MADAIITTQGLTKVYEGMTKALKGATVTIDEGDWTTIMGPSGSGKSTFLNLIGCLDTPTSGKVIVGGTEVSGLSKKQLTRFRRENIGLIFQQYHLVPYLNAIENVMLAQYFHSMTDEEDAREALDRVGLGHRLEHLPRQLSGGEQQRVCIARALINDPRILLADEPTGNLDQKNGKIVLKLMKELHAEGHTVVLVTHNPEIARLGDTLIRIIDGKVSKSRRASKDT